MVGRELELAEAERSATDRPRHVAIVGAGPAGLETARVAAQRGHRVTMWEAADQIGGALRFAALVYEPNLRLLRWYEHEMARLAVDIRLGTRATAERIEAVDADVVVVASGGTRVRPALPGVDQRHVFDGDDLRDLLTGGGDGSAARKLGIGARLAVGVGRRFRLLRDPGQVARLSERYMPIGDDVVVVGGGLVGIELAEFLAERGRRVTVLEEGDKFALEMAHPRRWRVLGDLRDHGVELVAGVTDIAIEADEVTYRVDDETRTSPATAVIVATGLEADGSVADALRADGIDPIVIGDAASVGYLEGAIHAGFHTALAI